MKVYIVAFTDYFCEEWFIEKVYADKEEAEKAAEELNKKKSPRDHNYRMEEWEVTE